MTALRKKHPRIRLRRSIGHRLSSRIGIGACCLVRRSQPSQVHPTTGRALSFHLDVRSWHRVGGTRRKINSLTAVILTVLVLPTGAIAHEPGDLDRSFSGDGVRYIDFGRSERAQAVFQIEGGGLIAVGQRVRDYPLRPPVDIVLARLHRDGRLDRTFGGDGKSDADANPRGFDQNAAWAAEIDGSTVALGDYESARRGDRDYLLRFRPDGSPDRAFGNDGLRIFRFANSNIGGEDLVIQPRGRILVLADVDDGSVVRAFRRDGDDASRFGSGGSQAISRVFGDALVSGLGRSVFVVGTGTGGRRLLVTKTHGDGSFDRSFGEDGHAAMRIGPDRRSLKPRSGYVSPTGEITVVGEVGTFAADAFVARFTADGRADQSFGGGDGSRRLDVGNIDVPSAVVGLPNGRLVVVGNIIQDRFGDDPSSDLFIAGLKPNGRRWKSFGERGIVREDFGRPDDSVNGEDAILADGKLVVVGIARDDMLIARYVVSSHQ